MKTLGLDTSNYTTSAAVFNSSGPCMNAGRLLDVPEGALGLRQSDALFSHVKRLPELFAKLKDGDLLGNVEAVGASTQPRAVEGSYMPCFLAGSSQAKNIAAVLNVPYFGFSHQQGHIAAAAWSAGRMDLLDSPFLAWHLSGGTTEFLYCTPDGVNVRADRIGGTTDISAGQLIDRTGKLLGLAFPAGKALDALAGEEAEKGYAVKLNGYEFSLSGMENKVNDLYSKGASPEETARFALSTAARTIVRVTQAAEKEHPGLPVLCSGGVASNRLLRNVMTTKCGAIFAEPQYSTDNAMGIAILTSRKMNEI